MSNITRNHKIDNMRALGMILIFLAHSNPPYIVNYFRCFDVILLVFLSNYMLDEKKVSTFQSYKSKLVNRIKRILLPTYVFITVFSLIEFVVYRIAKRPELFGLHQIINSYLLCENSVGYIWIMKIYILNFVVAPFAFLIIKKANSLIKTVLLLLGETLIYVTCYLLYQRVIPHNYITWLVFEEWILCFMAYFIVGQEALLNKTTNFWEKNGWLFWGVILLITIVINKISNTPFDPVGGKRPPNVQYLSYGIFITLLLYKVMPNARVRLFEWISRESLMLYFIHPIFVLGLNAFNAIIPNTILDNFIIKWIVIFLFSCVSWYFISNILTRFKFKSSFNH